MPKSILSLLLVLFITLPISSMASDMGDVLASKKFMTKVNNYMQGLRAKRANQTVDEIMNEKINIIEENIAVIAQNGNYTDDELKEVRIAALSSLDKFEGIEDQNVIAEIEIADLQSLMTSSNIMFYMTKENMDWYKHSSGYDLMITVLLTPFAVVGDILILPFYFIAYLVSSVSGY